MEEKKTKTIQMASPAKDAEDNKKLSYEQLNEVCSQLHQQNQQLMRQLQQVNSYNAFKRLDYLFLVLQNSTKFQDQFVSDCAAEIQEALSLPDEEAQES